MVRDGENEGGNDVILRRETLAEGERIWGWGFGNVFFQIGRSSEINDIYYTLNEKDSLLEHVSL